MERNLLVLICILVAACGQPTPANVAVGTEHPPITPTEQFKWQKCVSPGIDSSGNKWWGTFSFCKGDIRVIVNGYSAALSSAEVSYEVGTKRCPTGVDFGRVEDDAFFEIPVEGQTKEIRERLLHLLLQLKEPCGIPPDVTQFFDGEFDQGFRGLAESYWLHVPIEKIRAGRIGERGGR
jgi:hypothetical protein